MSRRSRVLVAAAAVATGVATMPAHADDRSAARQEVVVVARRATEMMALRSQGAAGLAAAEQDIAAQRLQFLVYGLVVHSDQSAHYQRWLRERYHISVIERGCVVTESEEAYADAYNARMHTEIATRLGADFWERVRAEADRDWHANHHPLLQLPELRLPLVVFESP